jgi:hypothetical protein
MLRRPPGVTAVLAVVAMEFVAIGAMDVMEVVLAIQLLSLDPGGAGYFAASFGAGTGTSRSVLDVTSRTILHRVVPPQLHGRVFGVLEGIAMLGLPHRHRDGGRAGEGIRARARAIPGRSHWLIPHASRRR